MVYSQISYVVGILLTEKDIENVDKDIIFDSDALADYLRIPRPFNIYVYPESDASKRGWTAVVGYEEKVLKRANVKDYCEECKKEENRWNCCDRCIGLMEDGSFIDVGKILDLDPIISEPKQGGVLYPQRFKQVRSLFPSNRTQIRVYPIPDDCLCCS